MIEEADPDIKLIREKIHREVMQSFHLNHGPELIRICDGKAKEIRINVVNKEDNNNMRHYGEKVIMKAGKITSMPMKELMQ